MPAGKESDSQPEPKTRLNMPIHYVDMEIRVEFDPEQRAKVMTAARRLCREWSQGIDDDGNDIPVSASEARKIVSALPDALMELVSDNPVFAQLGIEVIAVTAGPEQFVERFEDLPEL